MIHFDWPLWVPELELWIRTGNAAVGFVSNATVGVYRVDVATIREVKRDCERAGGARAYI